MQQIEIYADTIGRIINSGFMTIALFYLYKTSKLLNDGIMFYVFAFAITLRVIISILACNTVDASFEVIVVRNLLRIVNGILVMEGFHLMSMEINNLINKYKRLHEK